MLTVEFVNDFDDLKSFCSNNRDVLNDLSVGKECKTCTKYKECLHRNKSDFIESMPRVEAVESKFPSFFVDFTKKNIFLMDYVPSFIYKIVKGTVLPSTTFPCPFQFKNILDNLDKCEEVYNLLFDDYSKRVYLNVLMYRLTMNKEYLYRANSVEPQYYIDSFCHMNQTATIVDCGAYNGDSFIDYCKHNSVPQKAYLFEPDDKNLESLRTNLIGKYKDTEFIIVDKGVYSKTGRLFFSSSHNGKSYLSEQYVPNSLELEVTSIDDAIADRIDFIKMDIEGSEKDAIIGAKKHIVESYPYLAICVYHYPEDIWEIPLMIRDLFPDYSRYEIRHHSSDGYWETVLYVSINR